MDEIINYSNNKNTFLRLNVDKQVYNISGYSRAGLKTCIIMQDLNIVFDYGYADERAYSMTNKLISHGHMDHIGALHTDYSSRRLNNLEKMVKYIMPLQCIKPYKMLVSAYSHMNIGKCETYINMINKLSDTDIIGAEECTDIKVHLENELYCTSFEMEHWVKSYGYIIYRKSKRLKEEYKDLDWKKIKELKNNGIELSYEHYEPLVGYTGDTTIEGVLLHKEFLSVPLLIMECTGFKKEDIIECQIGKHIHIDDINKNYKMFNNKKILLFHFSQKYRDISEIEFFINKLDDNFKKNIRLFY